MSELLGRLGYFVAGIIATIVATLFSGLLEARDFPYPEVIVRREAIEAREPPQRPPTIVERVRYRLPDVELSARAPGGAIGLRAQFCAPVTLVDRDTATVTDTLFLIRSVVHNEPSWFAPWRADELRLTGPQNTGDLLELSFPTRGSFDATAAGGGARVRYGRFAIIGDLADTGARAWALYSLVRAGAEWLK